MGHWTSFFKKSFTLGFYNVIIQGINFGTFTVVARFLGSEEYGIIALITVFSGFLVIFSDMGMSYAVVREDYDELFLKKLATLSIYIGSVLTLGLIVLAYPIARLYTNQALILPAFVLSFTFLIQSTFLIPKAKMQKEMLFNSMGAFLAIGQLITGACTILMAWLGYSYWSLVFPQLFGLFFQAILFLKAKPVIPVWLSFNELKQTTIKIQSLLKNVSGFNMINYWARNSDNLLIGKFYGEEALGIYNYAYKLFMTPQGILGNIFSQIILPFLRKGQMEGMKVENEVMRLFGGISLIIFPISAVMINFSYEITLFLFGEKWIKVSEYLPFFGIILIPQSMISIVGNIFVLYKAEQALFRIGFINSIVIMLGILIGCFFSVKHIILSYFLAYTAIAVPVLLKFGFIDALKFNRKTITVFWFFKLVLLIPLFFCIWFQFTLFINILTLAIFTIFLITEYKNINQMFSHFLSSIIR